MLAGQLAEDGAEVRGHGQVASFVEGGGREAGEVAVDLAAVHLVAQHEEAGAVAVVGASGAVLADGAAELGHGGEENLILVGAEVRPESLDGLGELGRKAQEKILGIPARLKRSADHMETKSKGKTFSFEVVFNREFAME